MGYEKGPSAPWKLKLMVDKKTNKVIFAEAGKSMVDFLLSLLTHPIGHITKLLTDNDIDMVGSIAHLNNSAANLISSHHILHNIKDFKSSLPNQSSSSKSSSTYSSSSGGSEDELDKVGQSYAKDVVYMVTDDLKMNPTSAFSCMSLLRESNVSSIDDLKEVTVEVGFQKGLALMRASLQYSSNVLSNVFAKEVRSKCRLFGTTKFTTFQENEMLILS